MPDLDNNPRRTIKVLAQCDQIQSDFARLCAELVRAGKTEGDAAALDLKADAYAQDAANWLSAAPSFPKGVDTEI